MHTSAVLNSQESLEGQLVYLSHAHAVSLSLYLLLFPFSSVFFSPSSCISNTHTCSQTRFTQRERASATVAAKLTQHFSHNSFVTVMKQPWLSPDLHQYNLSNGVSVQKELLQSFASLYSLSKCLQTAVYVFVWYLHLCQQVRSMSVHGVCQCAFIYLDLLGLIPSTQADRGACRAQN